MRKTIFVACGAVIFTAIVAVACTMGATPDASMQATSNQATIDAAAGATANAMVTEPFTEVVTEVVTLSEEAMHATIDAAVAATITAMPPETTAEYAETAEEDMAAMIDESVNDAAAASEEYVAASEEAVADGTITEEELDELYECYTLLEETIALTEELLGAYYYFYGDLATETLDLLYMVEEDLEDLEAAAMAADQALQEIEAALDTGAALTQEIVNQVLTTAETLQATAGDAQAVVDDLQATLQAEIADRVDTALAAAPTTIPGDRLAAIQAGFAYVDSIRAAMADQRVSADELAAIAALGANASAGLSQFAALDSGQFLELINGASGITANLAGGQNAAALANLGNLESALGALPGAGGFRP